MNLCRLVGVLGLTLVLGCASPPPTDRPSAKRNLPAEAMLAFDERDWSRAADLLRLALAQDPGDAGLHYYSAVAATHLDRRDDAIREFRWILANVAPDLPEAVDARRWLIEAGVLARPAETGAVAPRPRHRRDARRQWPAGTGRVGGGAADSAGAALSQGRAEEPELGAAVGVADG